MSCPLTNAIFGIVGVLVGGLIGHWLSGVRDSASRKREFLGFLKRWRAEISLPIQTTTATAGINVHEAAYRFRLPDFVREVELVRGSFGDRNNFDSLTKTLGSLNADDWQKKSQNPKEFICDVIDELLKLCS
jgi:hypothetical protein